MTVHITRTATIVAFRARADVEDPAVYNQLVRRVTTFKGTILGTTADGYDLVAAFNDESAAMRFLETYFEGELDGPPGVYIIADATV